MSPSVDFAIVGPTHPFKGGIAQHTTHLARRLAARGHTVDLVSWSHQYPKLLYPGELHVPDDQPEVPPHDRVRRTLAWFAPWTWIREARRMRDARVAVFTVVNPIQAVAYLVMLRMLRSPDRTLVALYHNVVPHEGSALDDRITRAVLARVDVALTHSDKEAAAATERGARRVVSVPLPPSLPATRDPERVVRTDATAPLKVLFFGLVREYKGLDILLDALAQVPEATLTVVGEFWGGTEPYERQIARLGIGDRVTLVPGYAKGEEVPALFHAADVAAFPYRSATSSGAALLALDCGVPIIVTEVGSLPEVVDGGRYGLVCPPTDPDALAQSLRDAADLERLAAWDDALVAREGSDEQAWAAYVDAVEELGR